MVIIKNEQQIKLMEEGGKRLRGILQTLLHQIKPGIYTASLDKLALELILKAGGKPSFTTVKNYRFATCMCVNDEVVHGIPDDFLKEGDILCIDVGLLYSGLHTDTAWTVLVQSSPPKVDPPRAEKCKVQPFDCAQGKSAKEKEIERFLGTGQLALQKAISQARVGNRIGHISLAIQKTIEEAGYSVVKSLIGHGVGINLHEDLQIPGYLDCNLTKTPILENGMTLAIEVIYNQGSPEVVYKGTDDWTIVTKDGSLSAVFEHTIAVTNKGPQILT